jgi:hypothetical protein
VPEADDELLRPYITLQAAADTRVHQAEVAMIPLSPPMERTWRDIREVFSLIGLHGNSGLRAPAQAATEVNHQRIGPSDGSFMIFGVPVTSMPPKGLSVPLLVPPPRPEVAGAVTFPPAGGFVGKVA